MSNFNKPEKSRFNSVVVKEIAECTDNNDHGYALVLGSQMLRHSKLQAVFTHINLIAEVEHGYDSKLMELRYSRYQELMTYAESVLTGYEYQEFYGAF